MMPRTLSRIAALVVAGLALAAPVAHAHTVEALDPLPPAAALVPAGGAGLFGADAGSVARSEERRVGKECW